VGKSSFEVEDWKENFPEDRRLQRADGRKWTEPTGEGGAFEPEWRREEELRRQLLEKDPNYIFLNLVAGRSNAIVETLYEESDISSIILRRQAAGQQLRVSIEETRATLKDLEGELKRLDNEIPDLKKALATQEDILTEGGRLDGPFRSYSKGYFKTDSLIKEYQAKKTLIEKRLKIAPDEIGEEIWDEIMTLTKTMSKRLDIPDEFEIDLLTKVKEVEVFSRGNLKDMQDLENAIYVMWWIEEGEEVKKKDKDDIEKIAWVKENVFLLWDSRGEREERRKELILVKREKELIPSKLWEERKKEWNELIKDSKVWVSEAGKTEAKKVRVKELVFSIKGEEKQRVLLKTKVLEFFWEAMIYLAQKNVLILNYEDFFTFKVGISRTAIKDVSKNLDPKPKPNESELEKLYKKYAGTLFNGEDSNVEPLPSYYTPQFRMKANKLTIWIEKQQQQIGQLKIEAKKNPKKSASLLAKAKKLENSIRNLVLVEGKLEPLSITLAYYVKIITNGVERRRDELSTVTLERRETRERLGRMREGRPSIKDLPQLPYTHPQAWVEAPEHSGIVRIKPIVVSAIDQAYGKVKKYVEWAREREIDSDFLQKDPEIRGDFAELVGLEMSKAIQRFPKQWLSPGMREFTLQDMRNVMLRLQSDYNVQYVTDTTTKKSVLRGYRIVKSADYDRRRFFRPSLPVLF